MTELTPLHSAQSWTQSQLESSHWHRHRVDGLSEELPLAIWEPAGGGSSSKSYSSTTSSVPLILSQELSSDTTRKNVEAKGVAPKVNEVKWN